VRVKVKVKGRGLVARQKSEKRKAEGEKRKAEREKRKSVGRGELLAVRCQLRQGMTVGFSHLRRSGPEAS
jgi:citrate lyase alpha subunit